MVRLNPGITSITERTHQAQKDFSIRRRFTPHREKYGASDATKTMFIEHTGVDGSGAFGFINESPEGSY